VRKRYRVWGIVQGVGFRPFVYALAIDLGLVGFVGNDSRGVFIEVEGPDENLDRFADRLENAPPPLAVIHGIQARSVPLRGESSFSIVESVERSRTSTPVSPDISICVDCLRELFDPGDRRYRYPFINCTNCGPRFTITQGVPYDRPKTTMRPFQMCAACEREYLDPGNRRFHAQPNACPACGPRVWYSSTGASDPPVGAARSYQAIVRCREALDEGLIVAVKGIGGFHLACNARSDETLENLRQRKGRVDKPFAVMARDVAAARRFAMITESEARLLEGRERPIVLLRKRPLAEVELSLSSFVAPGNRTVGVMLPYSPLHCLLVGESPLVMTSGNRSEEPIAKDNAEAAERLAELADAFLFHDREIETVCDDSVVRLFEDRELPIRRSRGYAPFPLKNPVDAGPGPGAESESGAGSVLAVGGELKATFCLTKDGVAYLSQHIGDMENLETLRAFERGLRQMCRLFAVEPQRVVCDLHPGYLSTKWAERYAEREGLPLVRVQHHHAHVASLMVESGLAPNERVVGLACDGTGYGLDGAVWGCEVLDAGYADFVRLGHLKYAPLPGGDAAIRKPYRMALAYLRASGLEWNDRLPPVANASAEERRILERQLEKELNCAHTSSLGRLFDAVAALTGVRQVASYEAQAALELESVASERLDGEPYRCAIERGGAEAPFVIDPTPALTAVAADVLGGVPVEQIAARFHQGMADLMVDAAVLACEQSGRATVALTGGVFQNVRLLSLTADGLRKKDLRVLIHRAVPPNDGGLALGQAAVASARSATTPQASS
jgi:hydrogenase maturation protein HypF